MASIHIQVVSICAGGDHAVVRITKDGQSKDVPMLVPDLRSAMTQDDREGVCKGALKMLAEGKTAAQFRTAALAGFTVTV